jgi:ATP-dependent DNA helicase DinG
MLDEPLKNCIRDGYKQWLQGWGFKPRYGQRVMIAEIAKTLADDLDDAERLCVVEAGTGTGKTIAYLIAAVPVARALGKKLVIATATVALQEQILYKDIPALLQHSELDFSARLAKGRSRYLCLSKLDHLLRDAQGASANLALYPDEVRPELDEQLVTVYNSMADALADGSWDGDRDNWSAALDEKEWRPLTTDHRQCTARRCSFVGQCSFFQARDALEEADCVVTNHDLVLADLALGGGAILPAPEDTIYVFDEGHRLPEKALSHFAAHTRVHGSEIWLEQLLRLVAQLSRELSDSSVLAIAEQISGSVAAVSSYLAQLKPALEACFSGDDPEDASRESRPGVYRFEHGKVPDAIKASATELTRAYAGLVEQLDKLANGLARLIEEQGEDSPAELEQWYPAVGASFGRAEASLGLWQSYQADDPPNTTPNARWVNLIEQAASPDFELHSTPILADESLVVRLWSACYGAVVTSATLTALGNFDSFRMRSGVPVGANYQVVPSPFDYQQAGTLVIPHLDSDPGDPQAHTDDVIELMPDLLEPGEGTLVLFSSRRQMRDVYEGLNDEVRANILLQDHYSKQELLRLHKEAIDEGKGSAVFGLAGLAEGIDLPGAYCSHVVIAKIPFAVPDDPVEAALAEWIADQGGNPFWQISVPDAALKLVQASGRLLRTETDTGRITVLDRRLVNRRYGKMILDSLPPFKRELA